MTELFPTLASIAAVVFLALALLARRRQDETRALLADVSMRWETAQKQSKHFEQLARQTQEQIDRSRGQSQLMEKALEETKLKLADRTVEWNKMKTEREDLLQRSSLQREHLLEQVEVITQQLSEAVKDKKQAHDEALRLQKELDERMQKQSDVLRGQLKEVQQTLQAARRDKQQAELQLEKLREQAGLANPEELKRFKLKLLRTEQLYTSMRGLREMAEERNRNWESALRSFALYILRDAPSTIDRTHLGPLVGGALEKIGARLIDERFDHAPEDRDDDVGLDGAALASELEAMNPSSAQQLQDVQ